MNTTSRFLIVILGGLALLLAACQGAEVASAPPTVMASPQPGPAQPSATAAPPTEPPPPTEPAADTPLPLSTATPVYTDLEVRTETSTSPDGLWSAELILAYPTGGEVPDFYQSLTVSRLDGSVSWRLVDSWSLWALGATNPRIVGWSPGAFYFAEHGTADGCDPFGADLNIRRLALDDGSLSETPILAGSGVALSPDGTLAAYVSRDADVPTIVVHDLATGEQRLAGLEIDGSYWGAGNVVWAPDGSALMLTVDHSGCGPPENGARSIVRAEVSSLDQQILIDRSNRLLRTHSWPEMDRAQLSEQEGGLWWMDAATGEITGPAPD